MIRFAQQSDIQDIGGLWDVCFADDASFRDRFVSDMFSPETSVVYDTADGVRGMLHFTLQNYSYHGDTMPAAYIFGVGTHPDHRGNGVAGDLMGFALNELRRRGVAVALLVPNGAELFGFYKKFGFSTVLYNEKVTYSRDDVPPSDDTVEPLPANLAHECNGLYEEVLRHRCHLCRTPDFWRFTVGASYCWDGGAVCVRRDGRLCGYAVYSSDGTPRVDELFAADEEAYNALRLGVLDVCGVETITMTAPACPHGASPFGMARVVDAKLLLEHGVRYRAGDFEISLDDPLIPENSCRFTVKGGTIVTERSVGKARLSPSDFTTILMEAGPLPYLGLVFSDD